MFSGSFGVRSIVLCKCSGKYIDIYFILKITFFFSRPPRSRVGGLAFAVLACFPPGWNGGFHLWRCSGGVSRSTASTSGFSPIQVPWVPVCLVSLALALLTCCLRHVQVACSHHCPSCSSHTSPAWFSL